MRDSFGYAAKPVLENTERVNEITNSIAKEAGELAKPEIPNNSLQSAKKYFKDDFFAAMIAIPATLILSIAFATASNFSAQAGIISAIVANLASFVLGGSFISISGPAAGLITVINDSLIEIGNGDPEAGKSGFYIVMIFVAISQILIGKFKLGKYSNIVPLSVAEGMIAFVGLSLPVLSVQLLSGYKFHSHNLIGKIFELPIAMQIIDWKNFTIFICSLSAMIFSTYFFKKLSQKLSPHLIGVVFGILAAKFVGLQDSNYMTLPANAFPTHIYIPDWNLVYAAFTTTLFFTFLKSYAKLGGIDTIEIGATEKTINNSIDHYRRDSDFDKVFMAMGLANLLSVALHGLTNIIGSAKTKLVASLGAKTCYVTLYLGMLLSLVLALNSLGFNIISFLPNASIYAVLAFTGWQLARPMHWIHQWHLGILMFSVFLLTFILCGTIDLFWGIVIGSIYAIGLLGIKHLRVSTGKKKLDLIYSFSKQASFLGKIVNFGSYMATVGLQSIIALKNFSGKEWAMLPRHICDLFKSPLESISVEENKKTFVLNSAPLTSCNLYKVLPEIKFSIQQGWTTVIVFTQVKMCEATTFEIFDHLKKDYPNLTLIDYDMHRNLSPHDEFAASEDSDVVAID